MIEAKPTSQETSLETLWLDAMFSGLVEDGPPQAAFVTVMTLWDGQLKHCAQMVDVPDADLLQRLRAVKPGDKIRVCLETDWVAEDIPTVLKDFCLE